NRIDIRMSSKSDNISVGRAEQEVVMSSQQHNGAAEEPRAVDEPATERADAARNRAKILAATQRLISSDGVDSLTMNEVARVAGVGVGTVYRRFGDHGGLVEAMMNQREHQLQQAMATGPPPLGP